MLSVDSPFLNIPRALDRKQAVFLDGMRHAVQIVELSYTRLCQALTELSVDGTTAAKSAGFTHVFLDAWAFIDAADRFRCLWEMQPNASNIRNQFSPNAVHIQLQEIRDVRNVSAHLSQKIDQIVALNSAVLGAISWVSLLSNDPLKVKTHLIRPGIMHGNVKGQFAMPIGEVTFIHGSGYISVAAGKHEANLSLAYKVICSIIEFAETSLKLAFQHSSLEQRLPTDMFGSAELDMRAQSTNRFQ
jgi:hypothetical protein